MSSRYSLYAMIYFPCRLTRGAAMPHVRGSLWMRHAISYDDISVIDVLSNIHYRAIKSFKFPFEHKLLIRFYWAWAAYRGRLASACAPAGIEVDIWPNFYANTAEISMRLNAWHFTLFHTSCVADGIFDIHFGQFTRRGASPIATCPMRRWLNQNHFSW